MDAFSAAEQLVMAPTPHQMIILFELCFLNF